VTAGDLLPSWRPGPAIAADDRERLAGLPDHLPEVITGVTRACDGITVGAFDTEVRRFPAAAAPPGAAADYSAAASL
jgi:hypothetical protein